MLKTKYKLNNDNSYMVINQGSRGHDIVLTIDINLQKEIENIIIEEMINAKENDLNTSLYDGSKVIVSDPNTGEILAIASRPSFNPSLYQNYNVSEINRNLPIWMTYEPGSTFKIITMASAIEEKVVDIFNDHFYDSGKCSLCGMGDSKEFHVSYHHNWFDHSDSRHPRVRTCSVHVYNNYYDGNSKYGIGATMGSSIFVENNYFRNRSINGEFFSLLVPTMQEYGVKVALENMDALDEVIWNSISEIKFNDMNIIY